MGKSGKGIPENWDEYKSISEQIPGTKFIAFKVPLKDALLNNLDVSVEFFDVNTLVEKCPNLGLVIDLTNTDRYYDSTEFKEHHISFYKLKTFGHVLPADHIVFKFFEVVEGFVTNNRNNNKLIGVHCTHGVNRTGYMIIRYMIQQLNMEPEKAISAFNTARGHALEKENYLEDLKEAFWPKPPKFIHRSRQMYQQFSHQEPMFEEEPIMSFGPMMGEEPIMGGGSVMRGRPMMGSQHAMMRGRSMMDDRPMVQGRLMMNDEPEMRGGPMMRDRLPMANTLVMRDGYKKGGRQMIGEFNDDLPYLPYEEQPAFRSLIQRSGGPSLHSDCYRGESSSYYQSRSLLGQNIDAPVQNRRYAESDGIYHSQDSRLTPEHLGLYRAQERRRLRSELDDPLPLPRFRRPTGEAPRLGKPYYEQLGYSDDPVPFELDMYRRDDRGEMSQQPYSRSLSALLHDDAPPGNFRSLKSNQQQSRLQDMDLMQMRRMPNHGEPIVPSSFDYPAVRRTRPMLSDLTHRSSLGFGARNSSYSNSIPEGDFHPRIGNSRFLPY